MTSSADPLRGNERQAAIALLACSFPGLDIPAMMADTPDKRIFAVRHDRELAAVVLWRSAALLWAGEEIPIAIAGPGATAARFRRQGLLADHQQEFLGAMRDAGCVLSGLETPITRWHHRNGWGVASAVARYQAGPQHLHPIRDLLGGQPVNDPPHTELDAVYRKAAAERFGFLARDDRAWIHRLETAAGMPRRDRVGWYEPDRGCRGYALYHHRPNGPDEGDIALVVDELIAITPAARLGLLAFLAEHDNVRQIRWDAPQDFPLPSLVREPRAIEPCWCVDKMLRVVDVSKLAVPTLDTPGAAPQGLPIRIEDPQAPWNTGPWAVEPASASTFRLAPCHAPTASTPCVIPATALGPLLSGYLPVVSAIAGGLIDVPASALVPRLQALFAAPYPPYCPDTW